jgi:hypothetical protein
VPSLIANSTRIPDSVSRLACSLDHDAIAMRSSAMSGGQP